VLLAPVCARQSCRGRPGWPPSGLTKASTNDYHSGAAAAFARLSRTQSKAAERAEGASHASVREFWRSVGGVLVAGGGWGELAAFGPVRPRTKRARVFTAPENDSDGGWRVRHDKGSGPILADLFGVSALHRPGARAPLPHIPAWVFSAQQLSQWPESIDPSGGRDRRCRLAPDFDGNWGHTEVALPSKGPTTVGPQADKCLFPPFLDAPVQFSRCGPGFPTTVGGARLTQLFVHSGFPQRGTPFAVAYRNWGLENRQSTSSLSSST